MTCLNCDTNPDPDARRVHPANECPWRIPAALDLGAEVAALQSRANAYDDAVLALQEVRGGPLSTTIGYLIRAGFLVPADPPPTTSDIAKNWPKPLPPRPAAPDLQYPLGRHCCGAPNPSVCHQRGLCWMEGVHPDSPGHHPAAPDATAGDGLREAMARELANVDGGALAAGSWWAYLPDADRLIAGPLRDVLAAAARDAEKVRRVEAVMARCNEIRAHAAAAGSPEAACAYDDAGEWIRRALDPS